MQTVLNLLGASQIMVSESFKCSEIFLNFKMTELELLESSNQIEMIISSQLLYVVEILHEPRQTQDLCR